jgi:membrane protease YdiL (CAAX protease family)
MGGCGGFWFVAALGINIPAVMRAWWKFRAKHLQIVFKYFVIYAGFTMLVMGVLLAVFVLLEETGMIASSVIVDLASDSDPKDKMVQLKFMLENSMPRFILSMVSMCVLAPIVEEVFFRRFLFVALRKKMSFIPALLISVIFFMAVHPDVALGAIGGIYLGYIYEKGKSLPANILIHSMVNFTVVALSIVLLYLPHK